MSKFKIGDKVVRDENIEGSWGDACAYNKVDVAAVCTVSAVWEGIGGIAVSEVIPEGGCLGWSSCYFRLATGLEVDKQLVAELQEQVALCCGTVADKEKMQQLTEELKQELTAAHFTIDKLITDITELQRLLTVSEAERASLVQTNYDLTQEVGCGWKHHDEMKAAQQALAEANDQRDAAVLAAKALGDEVQHLRQERREYRRGLAEAVGLLTTLEAGVADVDLLVLSSQLDQIGRMCDEQGNGADAKLAFDAAQVVDMVGRTLTKFADE